MGFPHEIPPLPASYPPGLKDVKYVPIVEMIKSLVPEAEIHDHRVFDIEEARESPKLETSISSGTGDPTKTSDGSGMSEKYSNKAECSANTQKGRNSLSTSQLKDRAALLLKDIQQKSRGTNCILAGYGLGGILVKQVVDMASSSLDYENLSLRISRLVSLISLSSNYFRGSSQFFLGMLIVTGLLRDTSSIE